MVLNGRYGIINMNRRKFIIAGVAAGVAIALLKPRNNGGPYTPYFAALNRSLKSTGNYLPNILIDLDKLDLNIQALQATINPKTDLRLVAKSLPSPELLGYIMEKSGTNKLMVFHQPFLSHIANAYPASDLLLGKPMPVNVAKTFYQQHSANSTFIPEKQLQWLIDTEERLQQYLSLAQALNIKVQVNVEIDVGLHRGGLQHAETLDALLTIIKKNSQHLQFSGFMGYDPHVVKLPSIIKSADDAYQESQAIYQSFIDRLYQFDEQYKKRKLCFNGAGSPTITMHAEQTVANELSAGSCLIKPTDFDLPSLENFTPATYIATPVLKKMAGTQIPAIEFAKNILPLWDVNLQQTFFIYGGKWLAKYEAPDGLQDNGLYGTSTNQDMVNGSNSINISVDDHIFLRPSQSEFVLLQFGHIITIRNKAIDQSWSILKQA